MKTLVRFSLYLIGCSLVAVIATLLLRCFGYQIILKENGPIEWVEFLWLMLTGLFLFLASRNSTRFAGLFAVLWLFPLLAGVRELDRVFDKNIFDGSWVIPA